MRVIAKTELVKPIGQRTGAGWRDSVAAAMEREVVSCLPDGVLRDVWQTLSARGLQRMPVVDDDRIPIEIVYARDALQRLLGESEDEDALLRDYIGNTGYR